jgi:hypothetical protein
VEKFPVAEFGVKFSCPFNFLQSYHCIGQFPHDALHDFQEKCATCDGAAIIRALVKEGKITIPQYNTFLTYICLESYENSDRPLPLKESSKKLPGKGFSVALHVRLMLYVLWQLDSRSRQNTIRN